MPSRSYRQGPMSAPSSRDRILEALHAHGGEASPAALADATGLAPRTITAALTRLREERLVEGPPKLPRLTPAGRATAPTLRREPTGRLEEAVEACFGHTALAAFCRLGADLIAARHLFSERDFHPALFAYGAPKRGKTAAATLLARALGLEAAEAILLAPTLSPGAVVGRRTSRGGFEPAAHLRLPFLCLDEVGECEDPVRKQAQVLCHGDPVVTVEGERVAIAGTVMATWNPRQRFAVFSEAYWRRAVTINVDDVHVPDLGGRLGRAAREDLGAGTLVLSALRRRVDELSPQCLGILARAEEVLLEEGAARFELRTLELATLGRAARYGLGADHDLRGLVYLVGTDWLMVTETVPGLVDAGWGLEMDRILQQLGDAPGVEDLARVAAGHALARAEAQHAAVERRQACAVEDLELTANRAAFQETITVAVAKITRVPEGERPYASGLRASLSKLRKQAGEARSAERLAELAELAGGPLEAAMALRDRIDGERRRLEAEQRQAAIEAQQADREAAGAQRARLERVRAERDGCAKQLRASRDEQKALVRLRDRQRPGRDGASPAQALVGRGLLQPLEEIRERTIEPLALASWWAQRNGRVAEARVQQIPVRFLVDGSGRRWEERDFAAWGSPAVVELLDGLVAAADRQIAYLEQRHAQLKAAARQPLGKRRRALPAGTKRPALAAGRPSG